MTSSFGLTPRQDRTEAGGVGSPVRDSWVDAPAPSPAYVEPVVVVDEPHDEPAVVVTPGGGLGQPDSLKSWSPPKLRSGLTPSKPQAPPAPLAVDAGVLGTGAGGKKKATLWQKVDEPNGATAPTSSTPSSTRRRSTSASTSADAANGASAFQPVPARRRSDQRDEPEAWPAVRKGLDPLAAELANNPALLSCAGCSLEPERSAEFAGVVVHGLFSRYSQEPYGLTAVVREAVLDHERRHGRLSVGPLAHPTAPGIDSVPGSFLSVLLDEICVREEVVAYSHLLMRRTKEAHTPLSPQSDKNAAALSFVGRLVQAMYDLGVAAVPVIVVNACHLLHDERCSLSPHHLVSVGGWVVPRDAARPPPFY